MYKYTPMLYRASNIMININKCSDRSIGSRGVQRKLRGVGENVEKIDFLVKSFTKIPLDRRE